MEGKTDLMMASSGVDSASSGGLNEEDEEDLMEEEEFDSGEDEISRLKRRRSSNKIKVREYKIKV